MKTIWLKTESKITQLNEIKNLYDNGGNIIEYLKADDQRSFNQLEDILISYDFQAGSYTENYLKNGEYIHTYTKYIADVIEKLGDFNSIMEVGVGEGTTLGPLLEKLTSTELTTLGFDISLSRILYASSFFKSHFPLFNPKLFIGDLFEIPLEDNSIDIVYTSHSVEPNGGKEKEALLELYRVAGKYLILLEPSYNFGSEEARKRMKKNGYVTCLHQTAIDCGFEVVEYRLFDICSNPLNPTELIVIKKPDNNNSVNLDFVCPIHKTKLIKDGGYYFSEDALLLYPEVKGIPVLLKKNGIICTKFLEF